MPRIFIPDSQENRLVDVLLEQYLDFEILWFHWPYDGPKLLAKILKVEDYEPIIIIYKNKTSAFKIISRPGWRYSIHHVLEEQVILPVHILFEGEFHHPMVKTWNNSKDFNKLKKKLIVKDKYLIKKIKSKEIPEKFRIGKNHPTKPFFYGNIEDPAKYARKIHF